MLLQRSALLLLVLLRIAMMLLLLLMMLMTMMTMMMVVMTMTMMMTMMMIYDNDNDKTIMSLLFPTPRAGPAPAGFQNVPGLTAAEASEQAPQLGLMYNPDELNRAYVMRPLRMVPEPLLTGPLPMMKPHFLPSFRA